MSCRALRSRRKIRTERNGMVMKPCFYCGKESPVTFNHEKVFSDWSNRNGIISPDRSRFDGVREKLKWASLDETDHGAHEECALRYAVQSEGYGNRYPA